jgi:hypothetical protein
MDELLDEMHRLLVALRTNEKDLRSEVNAIQRILWDAHYSELAEHVSTLARIQQEAED